MISNILDLIGNTPLVKIDNIYAKLESVNPSGSIKDRMAAHLIKRAEERKELQKGQEIIEVTSGNSGISFAMISAIKGYKFTAVMPEFIEAEKQLMMRLYGASLILTPKNEDFAGAIKKYNLLIKERPAAFLPKQFENPDNIEDHYLTTGPEIIKQMNGQIDAFVASVGTGGTLIGIAKALKKNNPKTKIIAVEPEESPTILNGKTGHHLIEGIGEGFIPKIIADNRQLIDEIILIKSDDAINAAIQLAKKHGLLVGISSGANFLAAKIAEKKYQNVVTILPDRGERYPSIFQKKLY